MSDAEPIQRIEQNYVRYRGHKLLYFGGCDYFRLASHQMILRAVAAGLRRYGLNVAASRSTTGNHPLYAEVEHTVAQFFLSETALLTSSGYVTNLIAAQALAGQFSHALLDDRAHVALKDAAQLLNCPVLTFTHRDVGSLHDSLKRCGPGVRPIVLTDGLFGHNGAVAPLRAYLKLLPRDGLILVDDAHGAGTIGENGRGTVELEGVSRQKIVQNITLSKAFGVFGGAILCGPELRTKLLKTYMFIGSTPTPLPLAYAAKAAVRYVATHTSLRQRLGQNSLFLKSRLRTAGFPIPDHAGPLIGIHLANAKQKERLRRALLANQILPPLISYGGDPARAYFRFVIACGHSRAQLELLARTLAPFANCAVA